MRVMIFDQKLLLAWGAVHGLVMRSHLETTDKHGSYMARMIYNANLQNDYLYVAA